MEPRLQRLIELWSRSLEQGLDASAQRELDALLADAPLLEQFTQWQAERSPHEPEPSLDTPRLDAAVKAAFLRRAALKRWLPWAALGALAFGGMMAWAGSAGSARTEALPVAEEAQPDAVAEARPQPTPRRTLGLPPGYGQRLSHKVGTGRQARLDFRLAAPAEVRVEVLDASDRCVRTLLQGPRPAGASSQAWDGKDDAGHALPGGAYRLRARTYTDLLGEKQVELSPEP
jgi:hypothetical protein